MMVGGWLIAGGPLRCADAQAARVPNLVWRDWRENRKIPRFGALQPAAYGDTTCEEEVGSHS